jgi:tetratricopeptide (TPR) repeat protein
MAQVYSPQQACRHGRVSAQQLRSWQQQGLLTCADAFEYQDIVTIRALAGMKAVGLSGNKLRRALEWLSSRLSELERPLDKIRIYRRGKRLLIKLPGQELELWSGQMQFSFEAMEAVSVAKRPRAEESELRRRRQEAERHFQRGLELEQSGAPLDEVMAAYRQAGELDPTSAGAFVNLGTIFFNARSWKEAEKHYTKALEADPNYPLAHFNLANLYDERGDRARAFHHYEEALRLKPGYADAHYNLALLFQTTGQAMKALKHWRTYLKLDPTSSWATIARREMKKLQGAALISSHRVTTTA